MKKIINIIFLALYCFPVLRGIPSAAEKALTPSYYENYDYKTFSALPAANQRIDMNSIDYPLLHAAIFHETNRKRALHGMKPFIHSQALEKSAAGHSEDMVKYNFFAHESPVAGKESVEKRLRAAGIRSFTYGENIGMVFGIEDEEGKRGYAPQQGDGYFRYTRGGEPIQNRTYLGLAGDIVAQWMSSPGHRANILRRDFLYLGVGAAHYKNPGYNNMDMFKVTQNFSDGKER